MAELEAVIEQKLIEQLIYGDSQWIYKQRKIFGIILNIF